MKSVVNDTDGIVRVAESVIPEIKHQDEVRVKIASSGLCGSDLPRIFKNGAHYYPITLGHEFSGYIDAVGSGVDDLHPGDAFNFACQMFLWNAHHAWHGFNGFIVVNFFFNKDRQHQVVKAKCCLFKHSAQRRRFAQATRALD